MSHQLAGLTGFLIGLGLRKKYKKKMVRGLGNPGLLTEGRRPALTPEQRAEMLEPFIFALAKQRNNGMFAIDFEASTGLLAEFYANGCIGLALTGWRGMVDKMSFEASMKMLDALCRQSTAQTNPHWSFNPGEIPEGADPLSDNEIRSIDKMWQTYLMARHSSLTKDRFKDVLADVADTNALTDFAEELLVRVP